MLKLFSALLSHPTSISWVDFDLIFEIFSKFSNKCQLHMVYRLYMSHYILILFISQSICHINCDLPAPQQMCSQMKRSLYLLPLVNAVMGAFGAWSACSTSCGRGTQSRSRTCTPGNACGTQCSGPLSETRSCGGPISK